MRLPSQVSTRLAAALVASFATLGSLAADPGVSHRPRLVVGIFIEGLSQDYIDLLRPGFGPDGFNRLLDKGLVMENVDYGPGIDATAATAILVTGASPSVNGVPSERIWSPSTLTDVPSLLPEGKEGSYSLTDVTPARLLVSTLSDEVRIADGGIGTVHSLASDPQTAVILSGHAGNSAFFISDTDGRWTSPAHYRETPSPIARRNVGLTLASRLDTMAWEPSRPLQTYPDLPEYKKLYPFRHTFPARETDRFKKFKASPKGNHEIALTATELIETLQLGSRQVTDMISVAFDLTPYLYGRDADNRIETMDAYLRLDRDIAAILKAVDRGAGFPSSVVFIAGTPGPTGGRKDDERWAIPTGRFSPRKAVSLLNLYLMAIHGNGQWATGYHNVFFHLNGKLAKERGVDISTLRAQTAEFLTRMSGVSEAFTIDDIIARRAGDNGAALQRNIYTPAAGDVMITVNPGWEITDQEEGETLQEGNPLPVVRWQATTSPVYIIGPGVEPATVTGTVDARAVAPTVARILRIRSPNAAAHAPVRL